MTAGRIHGALAFIGAVVFALVFAAGAGATPTHVFKETFGSAAQPTFIHPAGMAVDPATGDLLVIDLGSHTLNRYHPDGTPADFSALSATNAIDGHPGEADATPQGGILSTEVAENPIEAEVAVAPPGAAGGTEGDIYVTDALHEEVDIFDSTGKYLGQVHYGYTCGVAVDPSGDVFIGDYNGGVHKLLPTSPTAFSETAKSPYHINFNNHPCQVAAGAGPTDGFVFAAAYNGEVVKVASEGAEEGQVKYTVTLGENTTLSVDPGTGHLYTAIHSEAKEYDVSGASSATLRSSIPLASMAQGLAVNEASGDLYVTRGSNGKVEVYGPLTAEKPLTVGTAAASSIGETGATLNGAVTPNGVELKPGLEGCRFEWGETIATGHESACDKSAVEIGAGASPVAVHAVVSSLEAGHTYRFRLVAENKRDEKVMGDEKAVYTYGPASIGGELAIAKTSSATVKAQINPYGFETTCEAQYVDQAVFEASGYAHAATASCAAPIAAGFGDQPASAKLSGLTIGTSYHYRFVAHNQAVSQGGTTVGADHEFSTFGIESFSVETLDRAGNPYTQAGGHPYEMKVSIALTTTAAEGGRWPASATGNPRTIKVALPPGLIGNGNPSATPTCRPDQMSATECDAAAQIGWVEVFSPTKTTPGAFTEGAVFNLVPPTGVAAEIGGHFNTLGTVRIEAGVRTGSDYGVEADTLAVSAAAPIKRIEMTLWGVPADEAHYSQRVCRGHIAGPCPSSWPLVPFLTNPTSCAGSPMADLSIDTWQEPGSFVSRDATMPNISGCDKLDFSPRLTEVKPTTNVTDTSSGLNVDLHMPQHERCRAEVGEVVCETAEADLKDAKVTLPEGVAINPAAANGLEACSAAQIGYKAGTSNPAEFTPGAAECPAASRIGNVAIKTPLLDHTLKGGVFVAKPHDNPFDSLLAIYIAVHDPESGVVVKLPGYVVADSKTGELTATFSDNPQLPFEDLEMHLYEGLRAALVTPQTCGKYETTSDMTPWTSPEGEDAHPSVTFPIVSGPGGVACMKSDAEEPNKPTFGAGTVTPRAGVYSPFVLRLAREDGSQRLSAVETTLPEGLVGKLAGVPYCPQAAIDLARSREREGGGAEEQASPACPAASRVGTVTVGAGAGPQPYYVRGNAYLAGPYKGAPLSMVIVTPAVAGPYDFGAVVVRVALYVDPETARITARSDPIPQILHGIPLDVRSIAMKVDRPSFTLNPTSCDPMSVGGSAVSALGQSAALSDSFQVGDCAALGFKPNLSLHLFGKPTRGGHPRLRAVLRMPSGANIARASVALPRSEFLDQGHIGTVCTRVQFAEGGGNGERCPAASVYGYARAWSPLLEKPLEGPVFLRSSSHKLPDLVAALRGQIDIALDGRIDSVRGGIRTSFETVPDAPVSKFVLSMKGGRKGLLVNSTNVCKGAFRATAKFDAHNGKTHDVEPLLRDSACRGRGRR